MKKIELLAPAGDLSKLKTAIMYGADAVFIGGQIFSLRAQASNFTLAEIEEGVNFAHAHQKKIYVTVNIYPHDLDLDQLDEYLLALNKINIDAIIVSSLFIIKRAKILKCQFELHLSTQQSVANTEAMKWFKSLGINRIVLARECSLSEIALINQKAILEVEVFIHGGLCSAYSGQCTLSNNLTGRDANRGGCAHSCRWEYQLYDDGVPKQSLMIGSKDLLGVEALEWLKNIGVSSLKIEGRMKSQNYIASVVSAYRLLLDSDTVSIELLERAKNLIKKAENRPTTLGYFDEYIGSKDLIYDLDEKTANQEFIGVITDYSEGIAKINRKNYFKVGDELEILFFDGSTKSFILEKMYDEEGTMILISNKSEQIIKIEIPFVVPHGVILRKK